VPQLGQRGLVLIARHHHRHAGTVTPRAVRSRHIARGGHAGRR
jgi:hypothetical protein